jgi:hypothetical protein
MPSQSLHHVGANGTYNPILLTDPAAFVARIRETGTVVCCDRGAERTVEVLLTPGKVPALPSMDVAFVGITVLADPGDGSPALTPVAFGQALDWAIPHASHINILTPAHRDAGSLGAIPEWMPARRWVVRIECSSETAIEWLRAVVRLKRKEATVKFPDHDAATLEEKLAVYKHALGLE